MIKKRQKKDVRVTIRLTSEQEKMAREIAEHKGLSVSTYIRMVVVEEIKRHAKGSYTGDY
ncbi:MAG: hypothetical protein HY279_14580 [Nitrospinae bacterium]|nr:hypothetical protein [Nitrospinota bacterium]